jgi:hypothetical protein
MTAPKKPTGIDEYGVLEHRSSVVEARELHHCGDLRISPLTIPDDDATIWL